MDEWFKWLERLVWQPRNDERVERVVREVESLKKDMGKVKEQVKALEAFHQLAGDSGQ